VQALRAMGTDVIVSFGGAGADEPALHCPDPADGRLHAHQGASLGSRRKGGSKSRRLAAREEGATRGFTHSQMLKDALLPSC
jgi:hypothetical protein